MADEMGPTEKAWEVLRSVFKDGEDVVVEASWGKFFYGKLTAEQDRVVLVRPDGLRRVIDWDDVELMAHDGFPVSRLMRMTPEEAEVRATMPADEIVRELLDGEPGSIGRPEYVGGGCPFVAGPMRLARVFNQGNNGPRYWYRDDCEVLEFVAADGAVMHSYDTDHLFLDI